MNEQMQNSQTEVIEDSERTEEQVSFERVVPPKKMGN